MKAKRPLVIPGGFFEDVKGLLVEPKTLFVNVESLLVKVKGLLVRVKTEDFMHVEGRSA